MREKIKVGLIGMGAVGERILRQFRQHEEFDIAALCDRNAGQLDKFRAELPDAAMHANYLDLLQDETIKLIYLGVPPKFHHTIAMDIIKSGKHLLCEKPLANSIEEAKEMYEAAENAGIIHAMNFPMAYSPAFKLFMDKIHNGELGKIKKVELHLQFKQWPREWQQNDWISSREQGGFIREVAPHFIHMIHDIFGELDYVHSFVEYPEDERLCETSFSSLLTLPGGIPVLFNGIAGIGQQEHLSFKVFGDKGTLDMQNWSILIQSTAENSGEIIRLDEPETSLPAEFLKAIRGDKALLVSFKEGYKVQKVLERILLN
ncbi:Gfo/Idh/MocA family protein [Cytobacillus firmus]|uniref:Gfo/Idh/MocA family protein n=1 Tax=Cytobacillus firmus TaxID=1399 RepID=UPI000A5A40C5|nr:Gfo/Idh/MocA family oxidoreductase [Cytobacillus firmus]MDD9312398.1 Gfo/Idh/MocA family oxidoreductase [Cytobacillus firmus]MEC1893411.1 Gfo/Idh/MocA family oxidoreductase [Cytobacillus firmus]MED1905251.1 Gfo/Idh/MocA family oxidoreductase [Cytobacillus firmus]MED4450847.1 Gfo/Idh/MocA family oxidoreductase [Cytobacillus firmus]MED4767045.1 Gfo/Idh/MocA family oxidoreductase [Cytobacillus firmus]